MVSELRKLGPRGSLNEGPLSQQAYPIPALRAPPFPEADDESLPAQALRAAAQGGDAHGLDARASRHLTTQQQQQQQKGQSSEASRHVTSTSTRTSTSASTWAFPMLGSAQSVPPSWIDPPSANRGQYTLQTGIMRMPHTHGEWPAAWGGRLYDRPLKPWAAHVQSLFNSTGDPMWPDPEEPDTAAQVRH